MNVPKTAPTPMTAFAPVPRPVFVSVPMFGSLFWLMIPDVLVGLDIEVVIERSGVLDAVNLTPGL
jgi:hypothetical protein